MSKWTCGCMILLAMIPFLFFIFALGPMGNLASKNPKNSPDFPGGPNSWVGGSGPIDEDCLTKVACSQEASMIRGASCCNKAKEFGHLVNKHSQEKGVDPALVAAIIHAESGWCQDATSPAGAQGLMQLVPGTALGLGVTDSYDPDQNIRGGTQYIKEQLQRFKLISLALAAYNAGPGNVNYYGDIPPFNETIKYVAVVQSLHNLYKKCLPVSGSCEKSNIVLIALNEIGNCEDPLGSNNIPNKPYANGQPWCQRFVNWVYQQANCPIPNNNSESTPETYEILKNNPNWHTFQGNIEESPQPGDLMYTADNISIYHVGIVTKVNNDGTIETVEGNSSDCVSKRVRNAKNLHYARKVK